VDEDAMTASGDPEPARIAASEAVKRLRQLGDSLNAGGHPANLAEQIWDCCDAIQQDYQAQAARLAQVTELEKIAGCVVFAPCRNCGTEWPHPSVLSDSPLCGTCVRVTEQHLGEVAFRAAEAEQRLVQVTAERDALLPDDDFYIPERDGRRCVEHPQGDHELVCLTCLNESDTAAEQAHADLRARLQAFVDLLDGQTEPLPPIAWQVELAAALAALAAAPASQEP
jgi:hypothetical protein